MSSKTKELEELEKLSYSVISARDTLKKAYDEAMYYRGFKGENLVLGDIRALIEILNNTALRVLDMMDEDEGDQF